MAENHQQMGLMMLNDNLYICVQPIGIEYEQLLAYNHIVNICCMLMMYYLDYDPNWLLYVSRGMQPPINPAMDVRGFPLPLPISGLCFTQCLVDDVFLKCY